MWIDDLTSNEKEVLRVGEIEEEYEGAYGFSYDNMKGALSSLVRKGILNHRRFKEDGNWWNYYTVTSSEKANELREYFKNA